MLHYTQRNFSEEKWAILRISEALIFSGLHDATLPYGFPPTFLDTFNQLLLNLLLLIP